MAWFPYKGEKREIHPVAEKKPNAWGIYDMLGNVFEHTLDYHKEMSSVSVTDPVGYDTTQKRHEIDSCKEDCINLSGCILIPTKLGSHVESKDGQHGVVAEPFACVG